MSVLRAWLWATCYSELPATMTHRTRSCGVATGPTLRVAVLAVLPDPKRCSPRVAFDDRHDLSLLEVSPAVLHGVRVPPTGFQTGITTGHAFAGFSRTRRYHLGRLGYRWRVWQIEASFPRTRICCPHSASADRRSANRPAWDCAARAEPC